MNKQSMRTGLMMIWLLSMGITSAAQLYSTQSGKIVVSGKYNGATVTAASNHLHMQVDYDKAEMYVRLVIPTIITNNDSLNMLLQMQAGSEAHFTGKMNINYMPTKSHPKQKFAVNGILMINGISKAFSFAAVLEHFPRGSVSCNLSAEFIINMNEFSVSAQPGENKIVVRFTQLILKKPGEQ
ncbi:hypothetical protein [Ferruginibacter profundus]